MLVEVLGASCIGNWLISVSRDLESIFTGGSTGIGGVTSRTGDLKVVLVVSHIHASGGEGSTHAKDEGVLIEEHGRVIGGVGGDQIRRDIDRVLTLPVEDRDITVLESGDARGGDRDVIRVETFEEPAATFWGLPGVQASSAGIISG